MFTPWVKEGNYAVHLEFEDPDLRQLYLERDFHHPGMGPDLTKQYRRKVALVAAAPDERDLRAMRSLRLEKLRGDRAGEHSIRLNEQWRLILRFHSKGSERIAAIVEVVDYH